ncbi:MAG: STN domain-containing protein [Planctomycetota bacterium]|jgi:hypothetical protein
MRFIQVVGGIGILVLGVAHPVRAQAQGASERIAKKEAFVNALRAKKVTFEYTDAPLRVVVDFLRQETKVNMVVDPQVLQDFEAEGRTVNLKLKELSALDALHILLRFNNLQWTVRSGVLFITTPEGAFGEAHSALYNLATICLGFEQNPGEIRDLLWTYKGGGQDFQIWEDEEDERIHPCDLVDMIREAVACDTWDSGEFRITSIHGSLIVNHTDEVHGEIARLLRDVEMYIGPPIAFQARVLRVPAGEFARKAKRPLLTPVDVLDLEKVAEGIRQPFTTYRLTAMNGQRTHLTSGREFTFLSGRAQEDMYYKTARDGIVVDVQPAYAGGDKVLCCVRLFLSRSVRGPGNLPRMAFLRSESTVEIPLGRTLLFAGGTAPFDPGKGEGHVLAVLLQAVPGRRWASGAVAEKVAPADAKVKAVLKSRRLSVDFTEKPLNEVVEYLRRFSGTNIIIAPQVFEEKSEDELMVSLRVNDILMKEILQLVLNLKGLAYVIERGVIIVTTQEGAMGHAQLGLYSVQDLLCRIPEFNAEWKGFRFGEDAGPPPMEEDDPEEPITGDTLVNLIRENISPESWDTPPNQINFRQAHLIVRNQPEIHAKVQAQLQALREMRFKRVVVEGQFLAGAKEWLATLDVQGPSLSAEQCEAVEKSLAPGKVRIVERFVAQGNMGYCFYACGGRQIAFVSDWQAENEYDTDAVLDGWCFQGRLTPGLKPDRFGFNLFAACSRYEPPENPKTRRGDLATQAFRTDLQLENGGGILLGAAAGVKDDQSQRLLFLRVRVMK